MTLVDSHCHLYNKDFDRDIDEVINRAVTNGITKIFLPAIDSESHERLHRLCDTNASKPNPACEILPMMGLHPCSVKEDFENELQIVEQFLDSGRKYYAVGETGLDYYWDLSFKKQQIEAFERQIAWSIEQALPIVIHSRKSTPDCIECVRKFGGKATGIFHCFSGTIEEAKQIMDLGFYLGIGGVVTYKNGGLRELIPALGLERIVLETDAPYLSPVPFRGKRNEPGHIKYVCETIAAALSISAEEVAAATTANALQVFKMNS
jgi:TatD DNase family protein